MYCSQFWRLQTQDLGAIRSCKDPLSRDWLIFVSYMVEGAQKLCGISFYKGITHSSTLAWKIPWTEGPGGLQSMGSLGVGHDWATSLYFSTFMHWRRKWQPTPVFLPGESRDGEPGGLSSMGSQRVRQDWSDLAAAISFMRAPPSWPLTSQRHLFLIPLPLGVRISTYTFFGGTQISRP